MTKSNYIRPAAISMPCQQCGVMMPPATPSRQKKFCSIQCVGKSQRKHEPAECKYCGTEFYRRLGGAERKEGRDGPTYCSVECRSNGRRTGSALKRKLEAEERVLLRARRRLLSILKRRAKDLAPPPKPENGLCETCGTEYERGKGKPKTICEACADKARRERRREERKRYRASPSGRARRSADKAKRRARKRIDAQLVDPIFILSRDKWRCQLCGIRTPQEKRGSFDDDAPELDHIISLAEGGIHAPHNLQCACRACNITKGAESKGQMWLGIG